MKPIKNKVLTALLTIAALLTGLETVKASNFTVYDAIDGYIIVSRDNADVDETIYYRAVSLSAIAGQHFNAMYGSYTFQAGTYSHTFIVNYRTPESYYKFQSGTKRSYRFEVLDRAGFVLGSCDPNMTVGINADNYSGCLDMKDITVRTDRLDIDDSGYAQSYQPVPINNYFNTTALQAYLQCIGAQLRMTVDFGAWEKEDGYQYIQILVDETTNCDTGAKDGNPGTLNLSQYMAGFEHKQGSKDESYAYYSFPVTSVYSDNNNPVTTPWSDHGNTVGNLIKQKFKTNTRADDGRLIIPTNLSTLGIRFNASGSSGDTWYASNIVAHIQALDETKPVQQGNIVLSPGRHAKGNVAYISIPYSEIVNVSKPDNLQISTTWGTFKYEAGSGSNVLTFKGTITANAGTELGITNTNASAYSDNYLYDLNNNKIKGLESHTFSGVTVDADLTYTLNDFVRDSEGNYLISTIADVKGLTSYVNAGNDCTGITFRQTNDISGIGTITPIGLTADNAFNGTYDGGGFYLSGITINGNSSTYSNDYVGLFGRTSINAVIKNVRLKSSSIKGDDYTGGIVGYNCGIIRNCLVESSVTIAYYYTGTSSDDIADDHGGIAGYSATNTVIEGCRSAAKLTVASNGGYEFGGIVGDADGIVKDCLYTGNPFGTNYYYESYGTITGDYHVPDIQFLFNNYYTTADECKAVGWTSTDVDGARKARIIRLPEGVSIAGDITTYNVSGITAYGDVALAYNGNIYSGATQTVTLSYEGGSETFTMPAYNTTPLLSGFDNTSAIASANSKTRNVVLTGRTLWKDGDWNTLCLPFNVSDLTGTPLEGATLMELGNSGECNTGFDAETGVLSLDFVPASTIEAGHAYIVKWETTGAPISNPVFSGVTISNESPDDQKVVSTDQKVQFKGTYEPINFNATDKSILFMGASNTLYYPGNGASIGAFRSYFQVDLGGNEIKQFNLSFGDDDPTGINSLTEDGRSKMEDDAWYDLNGYKLAGKPTQRGIYIHNGRKEAVK